MLTYIYLHLHMIIILNSYLLLLHSTILANVLWIVQKCLYGLHLLSVNKQVHVNCCVFKIPYKKPYLAFQKYSTVNSFTNRPCSTCVYLCFFCTVDVYLSQYLLFVSLMFPSIYI